jgi:hypothetical protein
MFVINNNDMLVQEIDSVKRNVDMLIEEDNELQRRINKAIKYIEERSHNSYFAMLQADYNMSLDELLDILRGKDDE